MQIRDYIIRRLMILPILIVEPQLLFLHLHALGAHQLVYTSLTK